VSNCYEHTFEILDVYPLRLVPPADMYSVESFERDVRQRIGLRRNGTGSVALSGTTSAIRRNTRSTTTRLLFHHLGREKAAAIDVRQLR